MKTAVRAGLVVWVCASASAAAQNVLVTPLGSHAGELCAQDRALLFQDPTGVRVLYDPGRTVAGSADTRLGDVHVVLLSHVHGDHVGDRKLNAASPGSCAAPSTLSAEPHSSLAEIAAAKSSAVIVGAHVDAFLSRKIQNVRGGVATPACPMAGLDNRLTVPRADPCVGLVRFGGSRTVAMAGHSAGVQIATVVAMHSNGVAPGLISDPLKTQLQADNLTAAVGPANGYVVRFTNGLTAYLSGDTGHFGDMATIVRGYYRANLAVVNIGDIFAMGPDEAAFAVQRLLRSKSVIASHVNEVATSGGAVLPGTRTARFIEQVRGTPVHLPLSGATMEFDGHARCVAGCN